MDAHRFDALTRALSTAGNRRGLLGLLLTLSGLGGLLTLLGADETAAKGRRKRRKKRHKHGKGNSRHRKGQRKNRRKRCKAKSRAKICANRCGIVKNRKTCKKRVNCGSCACDPPCPVCQVCEAGTTPGACVPNLAHDWQPCGVPGAVCQNGACVPCLDASADLPAAVDAMPAGGTLALCAGDFVLSSSLRMTQGLTLLGAGAGQTRLVGSGTDRVLQIGVETAVTLQGLTVTGGAGGIVNSGTLTLRDVVVTGNMITGDGGGIFNNPTGMLTLEDGSRVVGNEATGDGGGIRNQNGTVILQDGSVVGGDTSADANTAGRNGGGIGNTGTLTLEQGSQVAGNSADLNGGGIHNANGGTLILETRSRVAGNSAESDGGGIHNVGIGSEVTLKDRSVVGGDTLADANTAGLGGGIYSSATLILETGSQVSGNTAEFDGGGIYNAEGTATLEPGAVVCGNTPDQCFGGVSGTCPFPGETCQT